MWKNAKVDQSQPGWLFVGAPTKSPGDGWFCSRRVQEPSRSIQDWKFLAKYLPEIYVFLF